MSLPELQILQSRLEAFELNMPQKSFWFMCSKGGQEGGVRRGESCRGEEEILQLAFLKGAKV
eukprot:976535-Pelagomonas_calceolata.AAC.2